MHAHTYTLYVLNVHILHHFTRLPYITVPILYRDHMMMVFHRKKLKPHSKLSDILGQLSKVFNMTMTLNDHEFIFNIHTIMVIDGMNSIGFIF
jgi:hypothetical protein